MERFLKLHHKNKMDEEKNLIDLKTTTKEQFERSIYEIKYITSYFPSCSCLICVTSRTRHHTSPRTALGMPLYMRLLN